jgi:DNA polymerase III subunit alpha
VNGAGFRDFTVAGMVNQAASRTTKTGRQMGSFVLEDKEGTLEIVLFGEDYLKYSHFLVDDQLLFVRGRVQKPSWGSKDGPVRYVIQVMEMKLLADVLSTAQKMEISLDLHQLTPAKLSEMHDLFSAYSGDKRVTFRIQEGEQGVRILGRSRNLRVRLERPLLEALESVVGEQAIKILA